MDYVLIVDTIFNIIFIGGYLVWRFKPTKTIKDENYTKPQHWNWKNKN